MGIDATIAIPPLDSERVLRHVEIEGHRLLLWWTPGRAATGQQLLGYAFTPKGAAEPLFVGDDYGCSPMHAEDSNDAVLCILSFLALRPGDTDSEYFDWYSPAQRDWTGTSACEALSCLCACDGDEEGRAWFDGALHDVDASEAA